MTEDTNAQAQAGQAEGTTTQLNEIIKANEPEADKAAPVVADEEKPDSTGESQDAAPDEGEERSDDAEDAESEGKDQKPKRSRSDRYKNKIAAQAARIAELERLANAGAQDGKDAPKPPKIEDFNGDYTAFEDARLAFNTERAVNKAISETRRQDNESRLREAREELVADFREGIPAVRERIPDYDQVLKNAKVDLRQDVTDLILSSEKGPHLAYELAKNDGAKAQEVNALSPIDAARYIGRLEARLSLPQPKKQTQAPTPIKPPVGGAAPSRDVHALAKSENVSDYIAAMNAKQKRA